jgi:hypothetical protein
MMKTMFGGAAAAADNTARKARHALESRESNFME